MAHRHVFYDHVLGNYEHDDPEAKVPARQPQVPALEHSSTVLQCFRRAEMKATQLHMFRLNIHVSKLTLRCMQCLLVVSLLFAVASCIANNPVQRSSAGPLTKLVPNTYEER